MQNCAEHHRDLTGAGMVVDVPVNCSESSSSRQAANSAENRCVFTAAVLGAWFVDVPVLMPGAGGTLRCATLCSTVDTCFCVNSWWLSDVLTVFYVKMEPRILMVISSCPASPGLEKRAQSMLQSRGNLVTTFMSPLHLAVIRSPSGRFRRRVFFLDPSMAHSRELSRARRLAGSPGVSTPR